MMAELKPCPYCGVTPKIRWEQWREISETSGAYVLDANHRYGCFFRSMNGTNYCGRMSAFNEKCLVEAWNRRVEQNGGVH